jgi:DNA-directed RNA polymerase subunit E'
VGIGPVEGLIHLSQITNDFLNYNKKTAAFVGKESKRALKKDDRVFAKVTTVSIKQSLADTKIGLTMRPEGLGKDEWVERAGKKAANAAKEEKSEPPQKEAKAKKEAKKKE